MTTLDNIPRTGFSPLPIPETEDGSTRLTGVELEFGGVTEAEAAGLVARAFGGSPTETEHGFFTVDSPEHGTFEIYLDTAFREKADSKLGQTALEVGRLVIPVEVVTPPLAPPAFDMLDALRGMLQEDGATGSRDNLFLGFGVHLNPQISGPTGQDIQPTLTAYALLESWLRNSDPIDLGRRLLPFVDPYPSGLVDALAKAEPLPIGDLIDLYLDHIQSRNHGLDMLPAFMHLDHTRVANALGEDAAKNGARPTYHYRLPDCRIDEECWSLAYEWNRWVLIERVAQSTDLMDALKAAWIEHRAALLSRKTDWCDRVDTLLRTDTTLWGQDQ